MKKINMSQSLENFVAEQEIKLKEFKAWWIASNKDDPEGFPMVLDSDNNGLWLEMLNEFSLSFVQSK